MARDSVYFYDLHFYEPILFLHVNTEIRIPLASAQLNFTLTFLWQDEMHTHTFIVFRGVMLFYWWWCYCCDLLCHYCNCLLENMPATSSIPLQNASTKNNVFFLNARVWCSVSSKNYQPAWCRLPFHVTCYVALHHTFFYHLHDSKPSTQPNVKSFCPSESTAFTYIAKRWKNRIFVSRDIFYNA